MARASLHKNRERAFGPREQPDARWESNIFYRGHCFENLLVLLELFFSSYSLIYSLTNYVKNIFEAAILEAQLVHSQFSNNLSDV